MLIPSGEGDRSSYNKVGEALGREFSVLTFDMPGFSRSSRPPDFRKVRIREIADQVAALLQSLGHAPATVYGCSSGGHELGEECVGRVRANMVTWMRHYVHDGESPPTVHASGRLRRSPGVNVARSAVARLGTPTWIAARPTDIGRAPTFCDCRVELELSSPPPRPSAAVSQ